MTFEGKRSRTFGIYFDSAMSSHQAHIDASNFHLGSWPRGGGHLVVGRSQDDDVIRAAESFERGFAPIDEGYNGVAVSGRTAMSNDGEISVIDSIKNHGMAFDA